MRLATKITGTMGLLVALLVAVVAYQVAQVRSLAALGHRLSTTVFAAASLELQLERQRARVEDLTRRAWVRQGDPDYLSGVERAQERFDELLAELAALPLSEGESIAFQALRETWSEYRDHWSRLTIDGRVGAIDEPTIERLAHMGRTIAALARTTEAAIDTMRSRAEADRRAAERVSWTAALAALALTLPIVVLAVRSVRGPLRRLVEGTRAVGEGAYPARLEVTGADEMTELAASFNHMVERLRELDELKQGFIAHISHELRTPVVAMRETTEALLEELAGPLTSRQRRLLELHRDGSERLRRMVDRLLDLARMEAGAMEYDRESTDLGELVREVVDSLTARPGAADRLRSRLPATPVHVLADRDRLRQVVENLVVNALKYSPETAPVVVRVAAEESDVLLVVEDEGAGVRPEDRQRIFEKFHRSRPGLRTGFGLGLAICREIVAAHGGSLWVEDREPTGSRFCVRMKAVDWAAA